MKVERKRRSGFSERSLKALVFYIAYLVLALAFLYTPFARMSPDVIPAILSWSAFLFPSALLAWALTGNVPVAALLWLFLLLAFVPVSILTLAAILQVGGGYTGGGNPAEDIATLILAQVLLYVATTTLVPLAVIVLGSAVQLSRLKVWLLPAALAAVLVVYVIFRSSIPEDLMNSIESLGASQSVVQSNPSPQRNEAHPGVQRLASPTPVSIPRSTPSPSELEFISRMEQYIKAQYNAEVGLYREAPNAAPNKYWVYSDAYLAGLEVSKWNVPVLTKWTVLVEGAVVPNEVFTYRHKDLNLGNGIWSEAHDKTPPYLDDWLEYADRILLAALNAQNADRREEVERLTSLARSLWDGKGMRDKFYRTNGYFQTYHTALFYCVTGERTALEVLQSVQEIDPNSNRFGGIYTEYDDNGKPLNGTDTNVETTSVTLLCAKRQLQIAD